METGKTGTSVSLSPLQAGDKEQFILDNQRAFKYGAMEEFGLRDDHFEEDGEIISRKTIENSISGPGSETYRIMSDGDAVGGVVLRIDQEKKSGELELLFVSPEYHSRGVGYAAWCAVEQLHPEIRRWQTITPYFEKRNIHFYVNRCGFRIVEFFNAYHPGYKDPEEDYLNYNESEENKPDEMTDEMFLFEKII